MRRVWVLFGDLDRSSGYASLGKMAVPFGLTDTVNPFTASTVWHAFGALANGVTIGYAGEGVNVSDMGVQGGAQFQAANTPVEGTAVPSKLNNFAADVHYDFELGSGGSLVLGASWIRGTAYCLDYPVQHFLPCRDNNPALPMDAVGVRGELLAPVRPGELTIAVKTDALWVHTESERSTDVAETSTRRRRT